MSSRAPKERVLAVDIGGSKLSVGLVDRCGRILDKERTALPRITDSEDLVARVLKAVDKFLKRGALPTHRVAGVTIPGLTDSRTGRWVFAPFSGIADFPVAERLARELGREVAIENDVNASALAERAFGICREERDYIWVTLSNGVGGGLVLNGKLYRGAFGHAGEIGHVVTDPSGRSGDADLEALASGRGIVVLYRREGGTALAPSAAEVAELARSGDPAARSAFSLAGRHLGLALGSVFNLLNIPLAVLGGGVARSFDLLEPSITAALSQTVFAKANPSPRVVVSQFPVDAALLGAAAVALGQAELSADDAVVSRLTMSPDHRQNGPIQ